MKPEIYIIEKATLDDAEWIAQFQIEMALETENLVLNPHVVAQGVKRIFAEPERGFYLTAKFDNTPVGCVLILKEWSDWRNTDTWWIHSVYIIPTHRRRRGFTSMFTRIEALARASGAAGLRLYVDKSNRRAQAVYKKLHMSNEHYELFEKMF